MNTLLLRLVGPMQSWGTQSRFTHRDTGMEPSKSGVVGLLCSAMSKPREERQGDGFPTLEELARLRMAVRVNREGRVQADYQTAGGGTIAGEEYGVALFGGGKGRTILSRRYYLADADFLVGLESDDAALLERLQQALERPVWPLCLGRKAFVPGVPVAMPATPPIGPGVRSGALEEVLRAAPWPCRQGELPPQRLRVVLEVGAGAEGDVRRDVPLSFEPGRRDFALRAVRTESWPLQPDQVRPELARVAGATADDATEEE